MFLSSRSGPFIMLIPCKNRRKNAKVEPWSKGEKWKLLDYEGRLMELGASGNASHLGLTGCEFESNTLFFKH